ncbi:lipase maturation factor family protein [Microbacterium betulae]|uniref:Lipase maturation factor family protein n=1 Tax=Microbacterium betulae TaxID=2981139 RepID=A0AA97I683_9MICO|nr:lipase maturation factor family protein [Microbacterium sp. AB]WOF23564.1 lipase maturation factor family protein [Microbacterium sp. AB]
MDGFAAVDFALAREVLQRGIAALYVVAFLSTLNQFRPLLGERGLLPAPALLDRARSSSRAAKALRPTVFRWIRYTDRRLVALCAGGIAVGLMLVVGLPQAGPPWAPMACFLALWLGYMSVVSIGQTFYGFGWEMLLLEAGFLAAFLGSQDQPPPTAIVVLFWWLVFRLEFGAGMIKIRGGREWRDLTALTYHHETQPMPGPLSRQAHLLPRWFHRLEAIGNHIAQLVVPWLLFAPFLGLWLPGAVPQLVGAIAAAIVVATQLWLVVTGNFAWLNIATIVLAFSAIAVPPAGVPAASIPVPWLVVTSGVTALYLVLSWQPLRNLFSRHQLMNASFNRWNLANAYGAFGTVTKERIEFVVEGTLDQDDAGWREYGFRGKPGDVRRRPCQVAPYHLRLDWLMWFLPLGRGLDGWFLALLLRLLEADRATLRLLAHDPFGGRPPRAVRVVSYRYRFATRAELRDTGVRWVRDRRRTVVPPSSLDA